MSAPRSASPDAEETIAALQAELAAHCAASERLQTRLGLALQVSRIGTWTRDGRTGVVTWSPELAELFGISVEQAPRTTEQFFALVHPDDRAPFAAAAAEAIRTKRDYEVNFRYLHSSGEYRWMTGRGCGLYNEAGELVELAGVGIDITEQQHTREIAHDRASLLRQIGDNLPDGALYQIVADPNGGRSFIYWSAGIERLIGVSAEEALADPANLYRLIHPDDVACLGPAELKSLGELSSFDETVRIQHRTTGEWRWVHLRSAPRALSDGRVVWDGIYIDVTERQQAENALRAADRRKSEFLAMLSHELRNPMAAMSNTLELWQAPAADRATLEWSRIVMRRQLTHLTRLVDDLLDVTRITSGKIQLRKERIDAAEVIDDSIAGLKQLFRERVVDLQTSFPRGELFVDVDRTRLEQILVNLLTNAAKYTPRNGTVWLTAARENSEVVFSVRDNGVGIPPETLGEMFELFAQGPRSIARSEGGLGLGLTIARTLVELHDGKIAAQSDGEGNGAEFVVRLPAAELHEDGTKAPADPAIHPQLRDARILVVDDHVDTALSLVRLLRARKNMVEVAHDGDGALRVAETFRPDIILLDLGLPGIDGYEVAAQLRACETNGARPKIIAISGYGQDEDRRRSAEVGIDHHLVKPVGFAQLEALLAGARGNELRPS